MEESVGWVDGGWCLADGCINGGIGDGWILMSGLDGDVG